jgi:hypothetical protein
MHTIFVCLEHLVAGLQKTLTFRAERPCFAPKSHPPAHLKATMWRNVVLIPFPAHSAVAVLHPSSLIPHPSSLILSFMWGNGGVHL